MESFTFHVPTKILFGLDKEMEVGKELQTFGMQRVLVIYGKQSIISSGLLTRVEQVLKVSHITYFLCGGVEPNPKLEFVIRALAYGRENQIDGILAIGGGSVIDTAKLVAAAYYYPHHPYDFHMRKAVPEQALPIGVILTISAAGSEMSTSCVISDAATHQKRGFNSEIVRPKFAILNPQITCSVSPYQTACGIVDIMMHTLERYFNPSSDYSLSDEFALGLLKNVVEAGKKAMEDPHDIDARAALMLASSFSHNGLTGMMKKTPMPVHQLEHALSGYYDFVAHGAGLSVLFPCWAVIYYKKDVPKFARFAREVMNVKGKNDEDDAYLGIVAIRAFFQKIGMPSTFKELGISDPNYEALLSLLFFDRDVIPNMGEGMDRENAERIYRLCEKEELL